VVEKYPRGSKDIKIEDITRLWAEGFSTLEIALKLRCSLENIYQRLKKHNCYDSTEAIKRGAVHKKKILSELRRRCNSAKRPEVRTKIRETVKRLWERGVYANVPRKLSKKMKERFLNKGERIKISKAMKRTLKSPEMRKKWSEVQLRRFSDPREKQRFSEIATRMWDNPEIRNKIINSLKKRYENDLKLRFGRCLPKGENHWNWKGGMSFERYPAMFSEELKEKVRAKDNYTCQICRIKQDILPRKLDVHHIDGNKKHNNIENLVSFCLVCHTLLERRNQRNGF